MRTFLAIAAIMTTTASWASPVNGTRPETGTVYERACAGPGSHCEITLRRDPIGYAGYLQARAADGKECTENFRLEASDVGYRGNLTQSPNKPVTITGTEDGLVWQADSLDTCPAVLSTKASSFNGEFKRRKTP